MPNLKILSAILVEFLIPYFAYCQPFTPATNANVILGMNQSALDWGDYDNDNDLDLIMIGGVGNTYYSKIYTNNLGTQFTDIIDPAVPGGFINSTASWADVDNDGDLDYVMTGNINACNYSPLVRNEDICLDNYSIRNFVLPPLGLQGVTDGSIDWGDFDNDGDLDLVLAGKSGPTNYTIIYENVGGNLQLHTNLPSSSSDQVLWADVDNDQDLDLYISSGSNSGILTNNNGVFTNSGNAIVPVVACDSDFGDYDNDGDLDLVVTGDSGFLQPFSMLYNNSEGVFSPVVTNIAPIRESTVEWGDYDNDGDLDLIAVGDTSNTAFGNWLVLTNIYRNDGANIFTPISHSIVDTELSNVKWADYDNDGDLDFLLTGYSSISSPAPEIYVNQLPPANANNLPSAPSGLSSSVSNLEVFLDWSQSIDIETPQNGLSYNIRVGNSPGGIEIASPMSNLNTGFRRKAEIGNANQNSSWWLRNLIPGDYFWSVQSIDGAFAGSVFSVEEQFIIKDSAAPTLQYPYHNSVDVAGDTTFRWYSYPNAISYQLQVDTSLNFNSIFLDTANLVDTLFSTFLELGTSYFWRVRANTASGYSNWSYVKTFKTFDLLTYELHDLPGVRGEIKFGDFDNDNDLDLALIGAGTSNSLNVRKIYENEGNDFTDYGANLVQLNTGGGCNWSDYDSDNDLDLFAHATLNGQCVLYNNSNGDFIQNNVNIFTSIDKRTVSWSDFDNDGDLDFAMLGKGIYRNSNGNFSLISISFPNAVNGDLAWGDYDMDLDMDLFVTGTIPGIGLTTRIYRNDGNDMFVEVLGHGLQPQTNSARIRFGDYDQDGDLDVLMCGSTTNPGYSKWAVYSNNLGVFTLQFSFFDGITNGDCHWGDFDNDGDLDIILVGANAGFVYLYNGTQYVKELTLQGMLYCSIDIGDCDNDNDLDVIMTGKIEDYYVTKYFRNNSYIQNTKPNPPINLNTIQNNNEVNFSWESGSDDETATSGLTYNLYVGSSSLTSNILTPMADLISGKRKIASLGNANTNLAWNLKGLAPGTYFWSVQSIDNSFDGSEFSPEQSFVVSCNNNGIDLQTSCDSLVWIDGNTYTSNNNTATWILTNSAGCDSLVTLNLTINSSSFGVGVDTHIACDSFTWMDGNTYTNSNNSATWIIQNSNGCDSTILLDLTIINSSSYVDSHTACDSFTWIDGNTYTSSNNSATWTLTNSVGCDSTISLNLIINNSSSFTDVQTACDSYSWIDGNTYTTSNNSATWLLTNSVGCDSLITLNLSILNSPSSVDNQTGCNFYTWIDGNTYFSSNNSATWLLTNAAGCDSLVTLNLTIYNTTYGTDYQTSCNSFTWIDGITYFSSNNTATWLLSNSNGCDSIVTLNLVIVGNNSQSIDSHLACDYFTWIDGNTYTTSNTSATWTLTNSAGCDSIITLDLSIIEIDTNTSIINDVNIISHNSSAFYQWLNCDANFMAIPGETAQTFYPTQNGSYAVELSQNGCVDTSACVIINNLGLIQSISTTSISIFPNPSYGIFTVDLGNFQSNIEVEIIDLKGNLIDKYKFDLAKSFDVLISGASGQYLIKLMSNEKVDYRKIIKL